MSTITDLQKKVQRLRDALDTAEAKLHKALIEGSPIKAGDLVCIDRKFAGDHLKLYGKVRKVKISEYSSDELEFIIAPRTKKGFHPRNQIFSRYGDVITKIEEIPQ
jgi:hypothetical protein